MCRQDLNDDELTKMPSCNLGATVDSKWKLQLSNRGNDIFVATVDDLVRPFMQCLAFYEYLKRERPNTGPFKELKLQTAQKLAAWTGNSKSLHEAMSKMLEADEYSMNVPHVEGQKG